MHKTLEDLVNVRMRIYLISSSSAYKVNIILFSNDYLRHLELVMLILSIACYISMILKELFKIFILFISYRKHCFVFQLFNKKLQTSKHFIYI